MNVLSSRHPLRKAADEALRAAGLNGRANTLIISPSVDVLRAHITAAAEALYDAMSVARAAGVEEQVNPPCKRAAVALDRLGYALQVHEDNVADGMAESA